MERDLSVISVISSSRPTQFQSIQPRRCDVCGVDSLVFSHYLIRPPLPDSEVRTKNALTSLLPLEACYEPHSVCLQFINRSAIANVPSTETCNKKRQRRRLHTALELEHHTRHRRTDAALVFLVWMITLAKARQQVMQQSECSCLLLIKGK